MECSGAIGSSFQFQVDIRIHHFIIGGAVADDQEGGLALGAIQEVMSVAGACRKANARARPDGLTACVREVPSARLRVIEIQSEEPLMRRRVRGLRSKGACRSGDTLVFCRRHFFGSVPTFAAINL